MLLGGSRPTGDVDFGLSLSAPREGFLPAVQAAVGAAAAETGLRVQYSTDIDRWSSRPAGPSTSSLATSTPT